MDVAQQVAGSIGRELTGGQNGQYAAELARHRAPGEGAPGNSAPGDRGMATAEYAVATLAAVGFAGLLLTVLRSGEVQELLLDLIRRALAVG